MLDAHGVRIRGAEPTAAIASFMTFFKCRSAISVPVRFRGAVIGRVFLLDPWVPLLERESAIQLGQRIACEVAPAAHNVFRLRRLRSRAEARERARIARELHDGCCNRYPPPNSASIWYAARSPSSRGGCGGAFPHPERTQR
jgi:signal transduction histidine kinase